MTVEFNPENHIQQLAIDAFSELLTNAQVNSLLASVPTSLFRDLFSLHQSISAHAQNQSGRPRPLNQGNQSRAQPIQAGKNAPQINGVILIEGPVKALEARLNQLIISHSNIANQSKEGDVKPSAQQSNVQPSSQYRPNQTQATNKTSGEQTTAKEQKAGSVNTNQATPATASPGRPYDVNSGSIFTGNEAQKAIIQQLSEQLNVQQSPELKPYIPLLLQIGHLLTHAQDLTRLFTDHPLQKLLSPELKQLLSEVRPLMKELKEIMQLVAKNPSLAPKIEGQLQTLARVLSEVSQKVSETLRGPAGTSAESLGRPAVSNPSALQNNPALRELLTSLVVKGSLFSTGAETVQQIASAKLPSYVVAPFSPEHRIDHRKLGTTLKKPGPEPIWEDHHEESKKSEEECEEEDEEEDL